MHKKHRYAYNTMFRHYPDVVDVPGMCAMLGGVGQKTGYRLLREEKVMSVRVGRSYRIPKVAVIDFLLSAALEDTASGEEIVTESAISAKGLEQFGHLC